MNDNKNYEQKNSNQVTKVSTEQAANNPFDNNQSIEKDLEQRRGELDKEQQFKEAQTERD